MNQSFVFVAATDVVFQTCERKRRRGLIWTGTPDVAAVVFANTKPSVEVVAMFAFVSVASVRMAGEVIVCTPVKVFAASVLANVAEVVGNVIVVASVPANVNELLNVSVLPAAPVSV